MAAQQTGFNILYNSNHSCIIHPRLPNLPTRYKIKMHTIPPTIPLPPPFPINYLTYKPFHLNF